ncbi:MAG: hypothetical protein AB8B78_15540 [Polaribacter sp.]
MRIIIIPFDDDLKVIETDILEIESEDLEKITNSFNYVMKDKPYHIEVYKSLQDSLFIQLGNVAAFGNFQYKKNNYKLEYNESPYESVTNLFKNYILTDGGENLKKEIKEREAEKKRIEKEKYKIWKIDYDNKQKKESKNKYKFIIYFIILIAFFTYFIHLLINDELRFIGRENIETKALVIDAKLYPVRGKYFQKVTYLYTFENEEFKSYFKATRFTGKKKIGDSIKIKFRKSDPSIVKEMN